MLTSVKHRLYVNGGCEIRGKIINIRQLQILIHSCKKFPSAWTKEIDFKTLVLIRFFSFFRHSLNHDWSGSICFSSLGPLLFRKVQNWEINTGLRICHQSFPAQCLTMLNLVTVFNVFITCSIVSIVVVMPWHVWSRDQIQPIYITIYISPS